MSRYVVLVSPKQPGTRGEVLPRRWYPPPRGRKWGWALCRSQPWGGLRHVGPLNLVLSPRMLCELRSSPGFKHLLLPAQCLHERALWEPAQVKESQRCLGANKPAGLREDVRPRHSHAHPAALMFEGVYLETP